MSFQESIILLHSCRVVRAALFFHLTASKVKAAGGNEGQTSVLISGTIDLVAKWMGTHWQHYTDLDSHRDTEPHL